MTLTCILIEIVYKYIHLKGQYMVNLYMCKYMDFNKKMLKLTIKAGHFKH